MCRGVRVQKALPVEHGYWWEGLRELGGSRLGEGGGVKTGDTKVHTHTYTYIVLICHMNEYNEGQI